MKRVIYPGPAVPAWDRFNADGTPISGWSCAASIELRHGVNEIADDKVADALIAGGTVTAAPEEVPAAAPAKTKDKGASKADAAKGE